MAKENGDYLKQREEVSKTAAETLGVSKEKLTWKDDEGCLIYRETGKLVPGVKIIHNPEMLKEWTSPGYNTRFDTG